MGEKLVAKPVVDDKFWIVESNGEKVGTLRKGRKYVLGVGKRSFEFNTREQLEQELKITFAKEEPKAEQNTEDHTLYDYPCKGEPHNGMYNVKKKLPIYTKTERSQSFFCAGYYGVKFGTGWTTVFSPKLVTLERYEYIGPFKTAFELRQHMKTIDEKYSLS